MIVVFDSPQHPNGGCIFADPQELLGGGGSGVSRLAKARYFERQVSYARTWPRFYAEVAKADREEILEIEATTPPDALKTVVNALHQVSRTKSATAKATHKPIGPKRKAEAVEIAENTIGSVAEYDIDAIIRHFAILRLIEIWKRDEEDVAMLLLMM